MSRVAAITIKFLAINKCCCSYIFVNAFMHIVCEFKRDSVCINNRGSMMCFEKKASSFAAYNLLHCTDTSDTTGSCDTGSYQYIHLHD